MKQKTPDPPSDEKLHFKTEEDFQPEETPFKISDDSEWFDDQRGEPKGFREVVRGIPIVPQKGKKAALTKEATKSNRDKLTRKLPFPLSSLSECVRRDSQSMPFR